MMNNLGKGLVLVHLTLAIVALTFAAGLYFQFLDYGWAEPQLVLDKRVASEFDKRVVAHAQAKDAVEKSLPDLKKYVDDLHQTRDHFASNHVIYVDVLDSMLRGTPAKGAKGMEYKKPRYKGAFVETTKGRPYDPPVLTDALAGIDFSLESYRKQRKDLEAEIEVEIGLSKEWTAKHALITRLLMGEHRDKEIIVHGIYDLLEIEKRDQDNAKVEMEYLEKVWAPVLQEAEIFIQRRIRLTKTRDLLLEALTPKKKKL